jgi:2'-deoxynucleoside 5'-phosphate N-hydrolase
MIKAYFGIKFHADNKNKKLIDDISKILQEINIETICITRDIEKWGMCSFSPEELMNKTFQVIDSCDIVIIELTEKGVGLGIEAGYASAKGKPIFTIADKNSEISTTLKGISKSYFQYQDLSNLQNYIKNEIKTLNQ